MKLFYAFIALCLVSIPVALVMAQATGDYRSTASGNWATAATWQRWNGTNWAAAATPPTGSELITIQSTDSVFVNVTVSITGTLKNQGIIGGGESLTIANGGTFQHDRDAGSLPLATWGTGSTLLMTGTTGTAPANRNQSFHHVTFNTPNMASNRDMSWNNITIGGNIRVIKSGTGTNRWQMTSPAAGDTAKITIMGDVLVEGGQFASNGSSNAAHIVIHQYGNVVVTGGNFSVSRGSQGSGSGSTRWYIHSGNFSLSNAASQNSNVANAWFVFDKAGTQSLTLSTATLTNGGLPIEVKAGTSLDLGSSSLTGNGRFTLNGGATLISANAGGIAGAIATTGTVILNKGANYTFNGSAAQVTSTNLPDTVNNLAINNAAGVTLSQTTVINGVLRLVAGVFDNTIPFSLGPSGSISNEGGSLKNPATSIDGPGDVVPQSFFVDQNYPNPFNPSTIILYGLPKEENVVVKVYTMLGQEVATMFEGRQAAGIYRMQFSASHLPSGAYIYRVQAGSTTVVKQMMLLK